MVEACKTETLKHKELVLLFCARVSEELKQRAIFHDDSKLQNPELHVFAEFTPKLKNTTYGSDEYKAYLNEMKPALDHHYAKNRHHPEHFKKYVCNGCFKEFKVTVPDSCDVCGYSQFQEESDITQMTLVDLVEMFSDWLAATKRHADGDIMKSIEINQKRFNMSNDLVEIFKNTARFLSEVTGIC